MMNSLNNFAVFILSHGRPDNIKTLKTLERCGYSGKTYIICDDEDKTLPRYIENFGVDMVKVFDKKAIADKVDEGNNFDERRTITHARNACFDIAQELGLQYFLQLDDDYYEIAYKFAGSKGLVMPRNLDLIFSLILECYSRTSAHSIALAQTGDFIGGVDNGKGAYRFSKRKVMNSFFCSVFRSFQFVGSINEDVNTYTTQAQRGVLFLTIPVLAINQTDSQSQSDGMTDFYLSRGTYVKSFTTVMMQPANVRASMMNANHKRIHHSISWKNTTPMIIREDNKK